MKILQFLLTIVISAAVSSKKPYRLSIFSLIPFTGNAPRDGRYCKLAQDFVLEEINKRNDVLPDYHVEATYADEGPASFFAAKAAITYSRQFEGLTARNRNIHQSAIMLGPTFTPGCKALGSFAHEMNAILIASACLGPIYTANRRIYPNLYRQRLSLEYNNYGHIAFIRQIGKWTKIGAYANSGNPINVAMTMHVHQAAVATGLQVVYFDVAQGMPEHAVVAMKISGVRVIFAQFVDLPSYMAFLCLTAKHDLTGPRYVFIVSSAVIIDPKFLTEPVQYDGGRCSKATAIEQMQNVIYSGTTTSALEPNEPVTYFNYTLDDFESKFQNFVASKNGTGTDYSDNHSCHDRILQAIVVLDEAEKVLKSKYNRTLRDYASDPAFVSNVINETIGITTFSGVRLGKQVYSKRLELDDEPNFLFSWSEIGKPFTIHYRTGRYSNGSVDDPRSYFIEKVYSPRIWRTGNLNTPPRDSANVVMKLENVSNNTFYAFIALSVLLCTIDVFFVARLIWKTASHNNRDNFLLCILLTFLACLTLQIGSVLFTLDVSKSPIVCLIAPTLVCFGLSFNTGCLVAELWQCRKNATKWRSQKLSTSVIKSSSSISAINHSRAARQSTVSIAFRASVLPNPVTPATPLSKLAITLVSAFAIINSIALAITNSYQSHEWARQIRIAEAVYDPLSDSLIDRFADTCVTSSSSIGVVMLIACLNLLVLMFACFVAYELRSVDNKTAIVLRIVAVSKATLFLASICVAVLLASTKPPMALHMFMAVVPLLFAQLPKAMIATLNGDN